MYFLFTLVVLETVKEYRISQGERAALTTTNISLSAQRASLSIASMVPRQYAQYPAQNTNSVRHSLVLLSIGVHRWHF